MEDYTFYNNTYSKKIHDDSSNNVVIETGDSKQSHFEPQQKIMRWDNEANLSIRGEKHIDGRVEEQGSTIKYITPEYEIHQYEKKNVGEYSGSEFEWLIPQKPVDNNKSPNWYVLSASLMSKNLSFHKQFGASEEDVRKGIPNPENVIGSYAVYYTEKVGLVNSGYQDYKTGKFAHIYRPKAIDVMGHEVWCELVINQEKNLLEVHVPWSFLKEAVYPVLVDPTLGYTSIGANFDFVKGQYMGFYSNQPTSGPLSKAFCYFHTSSTAKNTKTSMAIYTGTTDLTKSISGDFLESYINTTGWLEYAREFPATSYSAGDMWLVVTAENTPGELYVKYDTAGPTNAQGYKTSTTYTNPLSSTFTWTGRQDRYMSIYATNTNFINLDSGDVNSWGQGVKII